MPAWQKVLTSKTGGALQVASVIGDLLAATTAAAARTVLGALSTAGDTMTGNLLLAATGLKIGIGTSTPKSAIQLDGSLGVGYGIVFDVANSSAMGHGFYWNGSAWKLLYTGTPVALINYCDGGGAGDVSFYQAPSGTADNTVGFTTATMYLKNSNKRVGIGTTTPGSLLHVAGTAQVDTSLAIGGGTALTKAVVYTPNLTPANVAANTTAEETFTVTGLTTGDTVAVAVPGLSAGVGLVGARVSAANTLALTFGNFTAGALAPPAGVYRVIAWRS